MAPTAELGGIVTGRFDLSPALARQRSAPDVADQLAIPPGGASSDLPACSLLQVSLLVIELSLVNVSVYLVILVVASERSFEISWPSRLLVA